MGDLNYIAANSPYCTVTTVLVAGLIRKLKRLLFVHKKIRTACCGYDQRHVRNTADFHVTF